MNKTTKVLSEEEYINILYYIEHGFTGCKPNRRIAFALELEANLGVRIGDILQLTSDNFIKENNQYYINLIEQKTRKNRKFKVNQQIVHNIQHYCTENNIEHDERIFPITVRQVQKQLKIVCDYLGYENIGTHSFRKKFADYVYQKSDYKIEAVKSALLHSTDSNTTDTYVNKQDYDVNVILKDYYIDKNATNPEDNENNRRYIELLESKVTFLMNENNYLKELLIK